VCVAFLHLQRHLIVVELHTCQSGGFCWVLLSFPEVVASSALLSCMPVLAAVALIGEICSGASVAAAKVANARKIPMISPASPTSALSQVDLFYRTVPSDKYVQL
jgi:hypothetical protein